MNRLELQAAINAVAGGVFTLPAGVHEIDTPVSTVGHRRPYAQLSLGNATLCGVGPETVLRFTGDAGGQDWHGIGLASGSIRDLKIDTSALTGTSEQTHAIRITGPATAPLIERVVIDHPDRGMPGGDGIQIVGYTGGLVVNARVSGCTFLRCDRSGVAAHSGAHGLVVEDCQFLDVGDQDIDGEGSGDHRDWAIRGNEFRLSAAPQGDYAIQLHHIIGCIVADNRFYGRGIFVLDGSDVVIEGNSIVRATSASGVGVIEIDRAGRNVAIRDNTIIRTARAGLGYVIRAMPRDLSAPADMLIERNTLVQYASCDVISATAVDGLRLAGNTTLYAGWPNAAYGLALQGSPTQRAERTELDDNTWIGPLTGCVGINGGYAGCGAVRVSDCTAIGPTRGLAAGNVTATTGPVSAGGNAWPVAVGIVPLGLV